MNKKITLLYLLILLTHFSFAKDIFVSAGGDNSKDGLSIGNAVADLYTAFTKSAHGDVIYVDGTDGVISHPTAFGMNKKLTVIGLNNAIIDADGNNKIFNYTHKDVDGYLTIENIKFINGNGYFGSAFQQGGGFLVNTTGTLTFKNCVFEGHTTTNKHGGVFTLQQGTILFESCEFHKNTLTGNYHGGVFYSETDLPVDITISECLFTENSVEGNGGVFGLLFKDHATDTNLKNFKVRNSTFYNNSTVKSGGVLNDASTGVGAVEFENVTITGNKTDGNAGNSGGLMLNSVTTTYLIENSIIYGNKTFSNGEAISDLSMTDNAIITIKTSIFGAIVKNDIAIIEDDANGNTSVDDQSVYGSIATATNEDIPELTLSYDEVNGVVSFASDALPVNFADATLLSGSDEHNFLIDQLEKVRRVADDKIDAGAYQLNTEATLDAVLADTDAPTDPSNIVFSNIEETSFDVSWDASTEAVMFDYYEIQLNEETPITTTELSASFSGLTISTEYTIKIKAVDYKGNASNIVEAKQITSGPKTIYVKATGDDSNDGLSDTSPVATLLVAYNKADDGDVIEIHGTIEYSASIGINKNLTIRGDNDAVLDAKDGMKFFNFNKSESDSYLNLENITFKGGNGKYNGSSAEIGGAMLLKSPGKVTITECTFESNSSEKNGGAIAIQNGELEINKSIFKDNTLDATVNGGAIHVQSTTNNVTLNVNQSVFKNNTSLNHGGAINVQTNASYRFDISFTNTTFYENQTAKGGGAIFLGNSGDGTLDLTNVTIVKNRTLENKGNCGGIRTINTLATVTINNSLIYNNLSFYNEGDGSGNVSDISTNGNLNFTINNSIISAIVSGNTFGGSNTLYGTVDNDDAPDITLNDINANNVVTFDSDAIAVNHGSASYLSAYPTHESFLVDQSDNVRVIQDGNIDCGAYQINASSNIDLVLSDSDVPTDITALTLDEVTYNSINVSWTAATDNLEVISYKVQVNEEAQIEVFDTNYTFESLASETDYEVKVVAVDIAGNVSNVVSTTTTTSEAPPTPVVVNALSVIEISQTESIVTWEDPAVDGLSFEVRIGGNTYETSDFKYLLEGLTAETDYEVFVLSKNNIDEKSTESSTTFTTLSESDPVTIYINSSGADDKSGLNSINAVGSLQKAIELTNAASGSKVMVDVINKIIIDGTVAHTEAVTITESVEITGQNNATLDASNNNKFIRYTDGSNLILSDITFTQGNGTYNGGATNEIGGAIFVNTIGGTLDIENCHFTLNTSTKGGGVLALQSGTVNITSSSFTDNKTEDTKNGGVFFVNSNNGDCTLNIYQSLIKDNVSDQHGGVMIIDGNANSSTIFMQNSTLYNNGTNNAGGAIFGTGSATNTLKLENCTLTKNYTKNTAGNGGGIRVINVNNEVVINNTILYGNLGNYGDIATEIMSDFSIFTGVKGVLNSSIVGTVSVSANHATISDDSDGLSQYGTLEGTTLADVPTLTLEEIDEEDGVVGFEDSALPVAFADENLYTKKAGSENMVDQLNMLRTSIGGKIDCGAYQLDGTLLNDDSEADLPVELVSFNAKVIDEEVALNWVTASEINNDYFEIQSSVDGRQWNTIGKQMGAGNSDVSNNYSFIDAHPILNVKSYYRLLQYDFDGSHIIISPIQVYVNNDHNFINIFPNPALSKISIASSNLIHQVIICDQLGRKQKESNISETTSILLDVSDLKKGIYIVSIKYGNGEFFQKKLIKN